MYRPKAIISHRLKYMYMSMHNMAKFHATLIKWGNSAGINLPKPVRDSLNLEAGDRVEITDKEDHIIIKKVDVPEK